MPDLYKHQIYCFNAAKQPHDGGLRRSMAFFLEMGLGKTRIMCELFPEHPCLIIIACPISCKHTWYSEITKWAPKVEVFSTILCTPAKRRKIRYLSQNMVQHKTTVLIINYEQSPETATWIYRERIYPAMIIADESSWMKNHKAKRSKGMHRLRASSQSGYVLTGTPMLQGLLDLYSQMNFVEPGIFPENWYAFKYRYAVMGGFERKQVIGYKNQDHLNNRIKNYAISIKKEDVAHDLPEKIYERRVVELTDKEFQNYKRIKKEAILELPEGDFIPITNALAKLQKMVQASCGFYYHESMAGRIAEQIGNTKRKAAVNLVVDGDLAGVPIIIWSVFKYELMMLAKELESKGIKNVSSTYHQGSAQEAARHFLDTDSRVLIANPASLGYGMNFQKARAAIFVSNNFKLGDRIQAEARIHRIGQKFPVTIVDIVADKTIDQRILKVLEKKQDIADLILDELGKEIVKDGR